METPGQTPDLAAVPVFGRLDADERAELRDLMEPARFDVGQAIFREGGPEEKLYVITSGTVEVHKRILRKRRQHLATVDAPTVVGEMGLLTEPRAAATVEALTLVDAYGIDRDRLLEMLDEDSPAACKLVYEIGRTLAERMARTDKIVADVIAKHEDAQTRGGDVDVFSDQLVREWSF